MTSLNEYRTFCKIYELESITAAAKSLHKSVSAVSKQLSKLEAGLSIQLIDRSTKTITVTALGKKFYRNCKHILQSVDSAEQALRDEAISVSGSIVLSFPEVLLRTQLIPLITKFSQIHEAVTFDLRVSNVTDNMVSDGIDFAFRIGQLENSGLTATKLFSARLKCIASPAYITRHGKPESIAQAFDEHKMLLPTYVNLSEKFKQLLDYSASFSLHKAHLMNSETAMFDAVMQGMGVSALLDISIQSQLKEGQLVDLLPDLTLPEQDLYLVYHKRDYMPEKMRIFKAFMQQEYLFAH